MSIWTSRGLSGAAALFMLLAGCAVPGASPPQTQTVAGGAVVVAGPRGYCIDRAGSRAAADSSFVLLGSCAAISGDASAPRPLFPAVLTVTVAPKPPGTGAIADQAGILERYFAAPEGRAAMARDGDPESVEIVETMTRDGLFIVHARDRLAETDDALTPDRWRAIFDLNGQIVNASVTGMDIRPITRDVGLALVSRFAARIREETRAAAAEKQAAPPLPDNPAPGG